MSEIGMRDAALALDDLREDARYRGLAESGADSRFNQFRQGVERAQARCFEIYPPHKTDSADIRGLLEPLHAACTATLARFQPFIERALAALDR